MTRAIVTPPVLPAAALAELKDWLGITTSRDDAPLGSLLRASVDMCEKFTGTLPLQTECEIVLPAIGNWQRLPITPIQSILGVKGIRSKGSRFALPCNAHEVELNGDGDGWIKINTPGTAERVAVQCTAGLAEDWTTLPETLRHGILRLAAHQHRERDNSGASPLPPAAVAALWRPWRRIRLA